MSKSASGNGVIVCQGGRFGGFSFYINNGKPMFTYNYLGLEKLSLLVSVADARANTPSCMTSNPMVVWVKAEWERSLSMGPRLAKAALKRRNREYFRLMILLTLVLTTEPR